MSSWLVTIDVAVAEVLEQLAAATLKEQYTRCDRLVAMEDPIMLDRTTDLQQILRTGPVTAPLLVLDGAQADADTAGCWVERGWHEQVVQQWTTVAATRSALVRERVPAELAAALYAAASREATSLQRSRMLAAAPTYDLDDLERFAPTYVARGRRARLAVRGERDAAAS